MRVLLVGPDLEENLSTRYLASSLLEAGHEAVLAPYCGPTQAGGVLEAARNADAVGLSMAFQVRAREFLDLARLIKAARPALPVIAGGHWASCAARFVRAGGSRRAVAGNPPCPSNDDPAGCRHTCQDWMVRPGKASGGAVCGVGAT